jgi:hypothetical protein
LGHSKGRIWPGDDHYGVPTENEPLVERLHETKMIKENRIELVRVGNHAVEVPVEVMIEEGDGGWSPYFSLDEAKKLENVRLALQRGDLAEAAKHGRLFELLPISA